VTRAAVCIALLGLATGPPEGAARAPESGVTVHAWVENERGLPEKLLQADEFEVLVDDVAVPLHAVEPRRVPMSVVVLLDNSRTVVWNRQVLPRQLAHFASLLAPDDRIMLATVGGRTRFPSFSRAQNENDLQKEVRDALDLDPREGYGNTPLWDALHEGVTILARDPAPRALVLLSDGRATGNRYGLEELAEHAMANGVSLTVIAKHAGRRIFQDEDTQLLIQPSAPLQAVTRYTGGQFFTYPERQEEAALAMFSFAASTLRALHAFGFTPSAGGTAPHRVEIRSRRPGRMVHAPMAFTAR
jgi:hypothetical protein